MLNVYGKFKCFPLIFFMEFVDEKFDFMFHVVFSSLQHSIYCEMRLSVSCARYGDTSVESVNCRSLNCSRYVQMKVYYSENIHFYFTM